VGPIVAQVSNLSAKLCAQVENLSYKRAADTHRFYVDGLLNRRARFGSIVATSCQLVAQPCDKLAACRYDAAAELRTVI
jgi:hypothetical protein